MGKDLDGLFSPEHGTQSSSGQGQRSDSPAFWETRPYTISLIQASLKSQARTDPRAELAGHVTMPSPQTGLLEHQLYGLDLLSSLPDL